ncbi:PLP-dependent aspartate aminotransferase family protein [Labrenzia sp. PHM005]|uniref:trans-sulfuration enzyme family protein n=1 Tax=Labrenzia sp. PHM005 TaxID=2590016 RepID=UPI00113FF322|nr:PLP-dependent transferase [Labrenzia sp. PHM005]QDG75329.1 aminotransferase class I/II-fold pyridoxal phosphate-dependent enzyme [Labrenzia sp. PHM005]
MRDATHCTIHPAVDLTEFSSLTVPTYRASTIVFEDAEAYATRGERDLDSYMYGLYGTPTTKTLEAQITKLENGVRSVIVPSGQAGATIVFLSVLLPGETVLIPDSVYPPVLDFCVNYLQPRGIYHKIYQPDGTGIEDLIDPSVKLIWTETPGSTTMEFQDLWAIAALGKKYGILTGADNTWATPLHLKPLDLGIDFSMQALSKYAGGHSDLLLGSICVNDLELRKKLRDTMRMLGIGVSPDEVALVLRGIETMAVRLAHVEQVARNLAEELASRPDVGLVLHPALADFPQHALWKRDFSGASGVFSVVLTKSQEGNLEDGLNQLKVIAIGASWGGTRSLIAPMSVKKGRKFAKPEHQRTILRINVGLEDQEDLRSDLKTLFDILSR